MTEKELKIKAEKRLRKAIPDPLWEHLKEHEDDAFERALKGGEEQLQDLVRLARIQFKLAKEMANFAPSGPEPQKERTVVAAETGFRTAYEKARSEGLSAYLALVAGVDEGVRRFRRKVLGGKLLEAEQAHRFVSSPAAARYPLPWFKHWRVPLVGHDWTVDDERWNVDDHGLYVVTTFTVNPPGVTGRVKKHKDSPLFWGPAELIDRLEIQRARRKRYKNDEKPYSYRELDALKFPYKGMSWVTKEIPVFPGSVLDELRLLSEKLSEELCYPWKQDEAAWFVLTDEAPVVKPVNAETVKRENRDLAYGTINLSIEPWVPAETVRRTYQDLQRQMLGQRNGPVSVRNAAVFAFVVERLRSYVGRLLWQEEDVGADSWRKRLDDWNKKYPKGNGWHYEDDDYGKAVRNFQRDFKHRALPRIAYPRYDSPSGRTIQSLSDGSTRAG